MEVVFSAVIPVYNSLAELPMVLEAVFRAASRHGRTEIILVDHESTDGSWEYLEQRFSGRTVLCRCDRDSISAVRNYGAARAQGEFLAFLDSDCVVPPDYFVAAERVLRERAVAATGCEVEIPPDPHWTERAWQDLHAARRDRYVTFLNSANFVIRADIFRAIGGYDEGIATGEDAEICQRLGLHGHRIWESQEVRAVHLRNPKSATGFFRRQVWHGAGMFDSNRAAGLDKPTAMLMLHLLLTGVGGTALFVPGVTLLTKTAGLFLSQLAVPSLTVAYRYTTVRRVRAPGTSVFLYWLYYWARAKALYGILRRRHSSYWR